MRAYPRAYARILCIDRHSICGSVWVCIVGNHLWEVEGCRPRDGERGADVARGIADHKGGFAGGEGGGGDYEIAFIFARGGVEDNYEFVVCWDVLGN